MSLSSKLVILKNEKENSLIISLIENNKLVLGTLPDTSKMDESDHENYALLGELFKSIGTLDKDKKIKIYIHLEKTPLVFLILFVKINVVTGSDIVVFVKDKETIETLNDFLSSDPTTLKNLIPMEDSKEIIETKTESQCESNLKEKLNKLIQENTNNPDQFFSSTKNLKESLKDSITDLTKDSIKDSNNDENFNQIKNLQQTLEFIESISENDKFQKLLEGNNSNGTLQKEIQKLNLTLF